MEVLLTNQNGQNQLCLQKFLQIVPKSKICYISPLRIYKKIFFSGHFDEIFISKVDFCKFWLVQELWKKILIFDLRAPKSKISYISHKGIYKKIFFSGSNSNIFTNKVEIAHVWLLGKVPLRGLGTTCRLDRGGLWRCRRDSRSQIMKNHVRSWPFRNGPFLTKFGIFGQIGIWHLKKHPNTFRKSTIAF